MLKNYLLPAALALPIIFFLSWTGYLFYQEKTLTQEVKVAMQGYDPRDLLSGHYINLQTDWKNTDCAQFAEGQCPENDFNKIYRYYLPENEAVLIDRQIQRNAGIKRVELLFKYRPKQEPAVKELLIDGQKWNEWLNALPKTEK